jgi:hypothetical protein
VLRNVWYDTAASPLLFPTNKVFAIALQCIDWHKILFASDYPLLLYPRSQKEPDFSTFLSEIESLGLGRDERDGILGMNAANLLGTARVPRHPSAIKEQPVHKPPSKITEDMSVSWIASVFPETRDVLDRYGIPWLDSSVPLWEPLIQSACARGLDEERMGSLLREIHEAID